MKTVLCASEINKTSSATLCFCLKLTQIVYKLVLSDLMSNFDFKYLVLMG